MKSAEQSARTEQSLEPRTAQLLPSTTTTTTTTTAIFRTVSGLSRLLINGSVLVMRQLLSLSVDCP